MRGFSAGWRCMLSRNASPPLSAHTQTSPCCTLNQAAPTVRAMHALAHSQIVADGLKGLSTGCCCMLSRKASPPLSAHTQTSPCCTFNQAAQTVRAMHALAHSHIVADGLKGLSTGCCCMLSRKASPPLSAHTQTSPCCTFNQAAQTVRAMHALAHSHIVADGLKGLSTGCCCMLSRKASPPLSAHIQISPCCTCAATRQ